MKASKDSANEMKEQEEVAQPEFKEESPTAQVEEEEKEPEPAEGPGQYNIPEDIEEDRKENVDLESCPHCSRTFLPKSL